MGASQRCECLSRWGGAGVDCGRLFVSLRLLVRHPLVAVSYACRLRAQESRQ